MSETPETKSIVVTFRAAGFAIACFLGSFAIWMLAPELLRPTHFDFSANSESAAFMYRQRDAAMMAAKIGLGRGHLWADAAFAYGSIFWTEDPRSKVDPVTIERIRGLTEQAIAFAPYDSRLWLLDAMTYTWLDALNNRTAALLRMSYYTGPNVIELIPERLFLATQSQALGDTEFQELVRHDIQIAVIHKSELMPAIIAAFNNAPLSGKQFIDKTIIELDRSLLPLIHSEASHS
jgi:hypothetical protein